MAEHLYRKRITPAAASNADDMVSKNVLAQLRRDPPPRPAAVTHLDHPKPGTAGSGGVGAVGGGGTSAAAGARGGGVEASDLISTMAKRLGALEREMKERQSLLQQMQTDNALLKSKLKVAEEEIAKRAMASIEPRDDSAAVMHLRSENARLRAQMKYAWKQVAEMKAFLNDYGMVWMGEPEAEAELVAYGFGPADLPAPGGGGSALAMRLLSPEPSDLSAPRRLSHSGAAPGPSSAAAAAGAAAAAVRPPAGVHAGGSSAAVPGASGMSPAAAAALGRAGEGAGAARLEAAVAKRSSSFTAAVSPTGAASRPPSSVPSPRPAVATAPPPAVTAPTPAPAPLQVVPPRPAQAASPRPGLPVSMAELQAKVEELNDLAGDGCGHVVRDGAGQHVLAMQDAVTLVIYRDALRIHTMPPKPFNDPASSAVLRDILDGYFPYVLKRDFPDGVPLRVVDRTSETVLTTPGKRLGGGGGGGGGSGAAGGSSAASGGGGAGNIRTFDDIDTQGHGGEPLSRDKFLSRLPQAVIKNGKVIEIRSDISRILAGQGGGNGAADEAKSDVSLISTPVDALLSTLQRNHLGPSLPPPSREGQPPTTEVTTLQVKSMDGKQTYILKFKYDDTIGSLRSCVNAHHGKAGQSGVTYEIRSAFPARAYTDEAETLRQAGLIPNATLFLRPM